MPALSSPLVKYRVKKHLIISDNHIKTHSFNTWTIHESIRINKLNKNYNNNNKLNTKTPSHFSYTSAQGSRCGQLNQTCYPKQNRKCERGTISKEKLSRWQQLKNRRLLGGKIACKNGGSCWCLNAERVLSLCWTRIGVCGEQNRMQKF